MVERRFRALTQVAAHPASERLAYRASNHLRAYYQHMYDGIEDPPRMNPLVVLRWKHRTDEQAEAKRLWEEQHADPKPGTSLGSSRSPKRQPDIGPGKNWQYTVSDIERYNAAGGDIDFFIPPREAANMSQESLCVSDKSPRPDESQSSLGSMRKTSLTRATVGAATSMISLAEAGSIMSPDGSGGLSRATSIETNHKVPVHIPHSQRVSPP